MGVYAREIGGIPGRGMRVWEDWCGHLELHCRRERFTSMLDLRKLAAADMALHGARFAIAEFAVGFLLTAVLGSLSLLGGRSGAQKVLGAYLLFIALNYLTLLALSVKIRTHDSAERVVADLLNDRPALIRLSKQSLLLLIPILPLIQPLLQILLSSRRIRDQQ